MKKYLGIVKKETKCTMGINVNIVTRFSDSKEHLAEWLNLYPGTEGMIVNNNEVLNSFLDDFVDSRPITKYEKEQVAYQEAYV